MINKFEFAVDSNGDLNLLQNRSKKPFYTTGKVIQRLLIIDLYT